MSIYGHLLESNNIIIESSIESLKKYAKDDESKKYFEIIKKNKSWMENILNKCSEEAFDSFFENNIKKYNQDDSYDKMRISEYESFMKNNKKAPKVGGYRWDCNYIEFWFNTKGNNHDIDLFFQDYVVNNYIRKNEELKSKGFRFESDDYIGICIILNDVTTESAQLNESVKIFSRINAIKFIKGKKFDKKRRKAVKESWEATLYNDIPDDDKRALERAADKASVKVYDDWKKKYEAEDKDMLYYTYEGKSIRLTGYDEFFKLHKTAPSGAKLVDFDGYPALMTGVDPKTQYSGVGLDFESAVARVIVADNSDIDDKYYLYCEDYLGINVEFTKAYYEKIKKSVNESASIIKAYTKKLAQKIEDI